MIQHPGLLVLFLLALEGGVLWASSRRELTAFFTVISPVFFIYFLPLLASTLGWVNPKAPVLSDITTYVLPMALFLLLVTVDVQAIMRLGGKALFVFFSGSLGMMVGTVVAYVLVKKQVGSEFWSGFGALSASWIGGSANMIAVKEALAVPDMIFSSMVVVDTIVPYVWMGLLIAGVRFQPVFDKWNRVDNSFRADFQARCAYQEKNQVPAPRGIWGIAAQVVLLLIALVAALGAREWARFCPVIKDVISLSAWTILIISTFALALSLSPVRRLSSWGVNRLGTFLLFFVLTAVGAKAALNDWGSSLVLLGAGFVILCFHAGVLLLAARLVRAPMFLVAAASQANIGGAASAPVVAAVYEPALASVGLLLAIMGNIVGTYLGVLCAHGCRFFS